MIYPSSQYEIISPNIIKEAERLPEYLDDLEAKVLAAKLLRYDLGFAWNLLTDEKIFPFQEFILNGWFKKDYCLYMAARALGKCIDKESFVLSKTRGFQKIKDIEVGDSVYTTNRFCEVLAKQTNPVEDGIEIVTQQKFFIRGKFGHKPLIFNSEILSFEYKDIENVQLGEFIPIKFGMEQFGNENLIDGLKLIKRCGAKDLNLEINEDLYYLMGLILGDGCTRHSGSGSFTITSQDNETKQFLQKISKILFPNNNLQISYKKNNKSVDFKISNGLFIQFLKQIGFNIDAKAHEKLIPVKIVNSPKVYLKAFLQGLFDTDGCVCMKEGKNSKESSFSIGFSSSSLELIEMVRRILLNFGIVSSQRLHRKAGKAIVCGKECNIRNSYELCITSRKFIKKFSEEIGFRLSRKQNIINYWLSTLKEKDYYSNLIPVGKYLRKKYGNTAFKIVGIKKIHDKLSENRLIAIKNSGILTPSDEKLISSLLDNWVFLPVKNINKIKTQTIDIQVAQDECYWSDGTIHHNSFMIAIFCILYSIFNPGCKIVIVSSNFRRCLNKKSIIKNRNGLLKLENVRIGDDVFAREKYQKILNRWDNKLEKSLIIKTKRGYSTEGLLDHKILTFNPINLQFAYKNLNDLSENEILPIKRGDGSFGNKTIFDFASLSRDLSHLSKPCLLKESPDFYYYLGLLIGDGYINSNFYPNQNKHGYYIAFGNNDNELLDFFTKFSNEICPNSKVRSSINKTNCHSRILSNKILIQFLRDLGIEQLIARNKTIPDFIFQVKKESVCAFMRGLMDTDGSVYYRDNVAELQLSTSSYELAKSFHLLLLNLGIFSSIHNEKARGEMEICGVKTFGNESYKIKITGYKNILIFYKNIGFGLSRKQKRLQYYIDTHKPSKGEDIVVIPGIGSYLKSKYKGFARLTDSVGVSRLKKWVLDNPRKRSRVSDEDIEKIQKLISEDYYFDILESKTPSECETIDIEVDHENCYWGDGFINHNSKDIFSKMDKFFSKKENNLLASNFILPYQKGNEKYLLKTVHGSEIACLPLGCLNGKTRIINYNNFNTLENMCASENPGEIIPYNQLIWSNGQFRNCEYKYVNGFYPTKKIITNKGYSIEGTFNHKIKCLVNNKIVWQEFQNLRPGDTVLIDRQNKWINPTNVNNSVDDAYFLGLMLGDGSFVNKYYLQFTNKGDELIESVRRITKREWKFQGNYHYQESSRAFVQSFLDMWGLEKSYTKDKYIPTKLFNSSKDHARACLQGLFDTDGCTQISTRKGGYAISVSFCNTSEKLIDDIQYLLLNFGIISNKTIRFRDTPKLKTKPFSSCYELNITGNNAKIFAKEIGFRLPAKQNKLIQGISKQQRNTSCLDGIPGGQILAAQLMRSVGKIRCNNRPKNCGPAQLLRQKILTFSKAKIILDFTKEFLEFDPIWQALYKLTCPNYFYDTVKTVTDSHCFTYDLHVSDGNEYNANGFFSHNTGENLRGERANVLIIDEGLLVSQEIQEKVLEPFILANLDLSEMVKIQDIENRLIKEGLLKEEDRTVFPRNKIIVCSSAPYEFQFLHEGIFLPHIEKINNAVGDKDKPSYFVCRASFHIGLKHQIIQAGAIEKVGANEIGMENDPIIGREYWAKAVSGAGGFFNMRAVRESTVKDGFVPTVQLYGKKNQEYILSIDPSYSSDPCSDYFAMQVFLLLKEEQKMVLVHNYARAGGEMKDHLEYLTFILKNFNIVWTIIDATGTDGQFIKEYNESAIAKTNNIKLEFIDADLEADGEGYVKELHTAKNQWNVGQRRFVYKHVMSSSSNRVTAELLQTYINSKKILFGSKICQHTEIFNMYKKFHMPYEFKERLGRPYKDILEFITDQDDYIRFVQDQLALICMSSTSAGAVSYGLPPHCAKRTDDPDRPRKDHFSTLAMASLAMKHVYDIYDLNIHVEPIGIPPIAFQW